MVFYIRLYGWDTAVDQYYLNHEMKMMLHDSVRVPSLNGGSGDDFVSINVGKAERRGRGKEGTSSDSSQISGVCTSIRPGV